MSSTNKVYANLLLIIIFFLMIITYVEFQKLQTAKFLIFGSKYKISIGQIQKTFTNERNQKLIETRSKLQTNVVENDTKPATSTTKQTTTHTITTISSSLTIATGTGPFQNIYNDFKDSTDCSEWNFSMKSKNSKQPQIVLDSNKYLYPGIIWGPNNQIIGLKNSIYLAVTINRTIVVPNFLAQYTHAGRLSPHQVIDVDRLCSFVSCIMLDELQTKCNGSFDVVFEAMRADSHHFKQHESFTQMKIVDLSTTTRLIPFARNLTFSDSDKISNTPTLPGYNITKQYGQNLPADPLVLRSAFNTTAPCAIYASVYNSIRGLIPHDKSAFPMATDFTTNMSTQVLYSAITDAVRHPPCIVNAAKEYIRDVLGGQIYVALHWRYDAIDWIRIACRKPQPVWSKFICTNIKKIKPRHVAMAIITKVNKNCADLNLTCDVIPVYIAAPSTLQDFSYQVYKELKDLDEKFVMPSVNISLYLTNKFKLCWKENSWTNVDEIISLTEMELMEKSDWFFFSPGSTWSSNVRPYRVYVNKDNKLIKRFEADAFKSTLDEERNDHIR